MTPSKNCIELVKKAEGFSATPYKCPAGKWTNGYGHTCGVTEKTPPVDELAAEMDLYKDLAQAASDVSLAVTVPLTQGQFDALVSFTYNVGPGAKGIKDGFVTLKSGKPSTMLVRINEGNFKAAANEFLKWTMAGGKVLNGLVKRRAAEKELFES